MFRAHRTLLLTGLLVAVCGASGCKGSQEPQTSQSAAASPGTSSTGPDAKPGISVANARLVLPVVPGRPGVAYFEVKNASSKAVTLSAAALDGVGKAEMHKTEGGTMKPAAAVQIAPGGTIAFAPGGLHVMAFQIADTLKPDAETELTLTFSDGDKISIPAKVEAMGAAAAAHN